MKTAIMIFARDLIYDATVLGVSIAKHEFLQGAGVKISYVDPANISSIAILKTLTLKIVFIGEKLKLSLLLNY